MSKYPISKEFFPFSHFTPPISEKFLFMDLPPAYIETAEFDCLHDDGILYSEKLRSAGITNKLNL